MRTATSLPDWPSILVVVAHPDDESFGLGAVIDAFVRQGSNVDVLCFTRGEASTLGAELADLAAVRADELRAAADTLGIRHVTLTDHPDGGLAAASIDDLIAEVVRSADRTSADGILVFDTTGITSHPDHQRATESAHAAADRLGLGVLAWTLPESVAGHLREEFGAPFAGRADEQIDLVVPVDRDRQLAAAQCHPSQAVPGSALWRRLELLGDVEHLRWLRHTPD